MQSKPLLEQRWQALSGGCGSLDGTMLMSGNTQRILR
jgi:hypothetical protein